MNKEEFILKVKETHSEYSKALEGVSPAQLIQPKTCGEWSIKDVIAHVSWHERQMVGVIASRSLNGSPWWNLPLEERNAAIFALNKDKAAKDILAESRVIFTDLVTQLDTLSEDDLNAAENFTGMPPEWKPWEVIASNTFEHYPEHARDIRAVFLKQAE